MYMNMIKLGAPSRANAILALGALLALAVTIGAGVILDTKVYYPHVVLEPLENVKLEFLQEGLSNGEECHAAAARIVHAVHLNCPHCRVAMQQCADRLEPHSERLLSEEPVAIPSSRLPNGVVAYLSDDTRLALAACNETERLTGARDGFRAICYGPNTPRPMLDSSRQQRADGGVLAPPALVVLALIAIGGFVMVGSTVAAHGAARGRLPSRMGVHLRLIKAHFRTLRRIRSVRNRMLKRLLDLLIAVPLLLLLAPVFLCAMALLWLTEGRPIFYVSTRYIGLNRPVRVIKFRTMVRDASSPRYRLRERFMRDGYLDIPLECEVYTPIGRILERLQIVELPQLLNVLIDGMSLVGNRPLPKENLELLSKFPSWEERFESPAGITGISQVVGKLNLTPVERLRLESLYSKVYLTGDIIRCDLNIVWVTASSVFLRNEGITLKRAEALLRRYLPRHRAPR